MQVEWGSGPAYRQLILNLIIPSLLNHLFVCLFLPGGRADSSNLSANVITAPLFLRFEKNPLPFCRPPGNWAGQVMFSTNAPPRGCESGNLVLPQAGVSQGTWWAQSGMAWQASTRWLTFLGF